jgi:DNA polymerase delta subunit 1
MRKRDPASAPAVGDRVPFVIIKAPKGAPNYEKSEDPIWVLENDLPIDTDYYIENQLKGPLVRLFEPILGPSATDELFRGEHTLHIKVTSGSATSGSIMQFAKKTETCVRCRCTLPTGRRALCIKCEPRRAEVLVQKVHDNREHEADFSKLWSQCQRCQGSTHQEVLCSSRDCPIFYRRKKVQLDLAETTNTLERLSLPAPTQ